MTAPGNAPAGQPWYKRPAVEASALVIGVIGGVGGIVTLADWLLGLDRRISVGVGAGVVIAALVLYVRHLRARVKHLERRFDALGEMVAGLEARTAPLDERIQPLARLSEITLCAFGISSAIWTTSTSVSTACFGRSPGSQTTWSASRRSWSS